MTGLWEAIVLGAVEGITEFLPISSTAHLILTTDLLGLEQTDFQKSFDVIIQLGAIMAVVALYWRRFLVDRAALKRVIAAFLPTAAVGLALYPVIKRYLLGNSQLVLWTLFLGGLFLVLFERYRRPRAEAETVRQVRAISYRQCLAIGLFQALAVVPGVSRSAATIVGGLLLGLDRRTIVEFSFLLAVPTMAAAAGLDLLKSAEAFSRSDLAFLAVGFVVSFVTAMAAVRWLLRYVSRHDFSVFGWYRMALVVAWLSILAVPAL